jgi:kumamolisin
MLSKAGHNLSEVTWWEAPGHRTGNGGGSTGGGVSEVFSRPAWQNVQIKSLNGDLFDGRVVPDIAALAGPPFYDLVFLGKDAPNGGTSASAPLCAALIARLNAAWPPVKRQRFLTPLLYQVASNGQAKGLSGARTFPPDKTLRIHQRSGTMQEKDTTPSDAGVCQTE